MWRRTKTASEQNAAASASAATNNRDVICSDTPRRSAPPKSWLYRHPIIKSHQRRPCRPGRHIAHETAVFLEVRHVCVCCVLGLCAALCLAFVVCVVRSVCAVVVVAACGSCSNVMTVGAQGLSLWLLRMLHRRRASCSTQVQNGCRPACWTACLWATTSLHHGSCDAAVLLRLQLTNTRKCAGTSDAGL